MFHDVLLVVHDVLLVVHDVLLVVHGVLHGFHDVLLCTTMFYVLRVAQRSASPHR